MFCEGGKIYSSGKIFHPTCIQTSWLYWHSCLQFKPKLQWHKPPFSGGAVKKALGFGLALLKHIKTVFKPSPSQFVLELLRRTCILKECFSLSFYSFQKCLKSLFLLFIFMASFPFYFFFSFLFLVLSLASVFSWFSCIRTNLQSHLAKYETQLNVFRLGANKMGKKENWRSCFGD